MWMSRSYKGFAGLSSYLCRHPVLRGEWCPGKDLFNPSPQDLCTALLGNEVFIDVIK